MGGAPNPLALLKQCRERRVASTRMPPGIRVKRVRRNRTRSSSRQPAARNTFCWARTTTALLRWARWGRRMPWAERSARAIFFLLCCGCPASRGTRFGWSPFHHTTTLQHVSAAHVMIAATPGRSLNTACPNPSVLLCCTCGLHSANPCTNPGPLLSRIVSLLSIFTFYLEGRSRKPLQKTPPFALPQSSEENAQPHAPSGPCRRQTHAPITATRLRQRGHGYKRRPGESLTPTTSPLCQAKGGEVGRGVGYFSSAV